MDPIKILLMAFLALNFHFTNSEKISLEKLGQKMDSLTDKIDNFIYSVGKIDNVLISLVEKYTLHDLIDKCVMAIGAGNSIGVNKIWSQIATSYNVSKTQQILKSIVVETYGGNRDRILPLIRFVSQTKLCSGFETLFDEITDYDHFYHGGEIFSLANAILATCEDRILFERFPTPVQLMFTRPVSLQNTFNKGFLYRKSQINDNIMENQVATAITANTSYWRFIPASEFAESFYIKNGDDHLIASSSRRMYFSNESNPSHSKFLLEMNRKAEISIGVSLDDRGGKSIFYRLYASKQGTKLNHHQKVKAGDVFELNLWTINPKDEYYKYSFWNVVNSHTNSHNHITTTHAPATIASDSNSNTTLPI